MCGKVFKRLTTLIARVLIELEVKKRAFLTPYKTKSANYESSWLEIFAPYKVEAFDIGIGN
jgi:hypothetical protein